MLNNENSSDYQTITTIEAFDSLFDEINKDSNQLNQIYQSNKNEKISLNKSLLHKSNKTKSFKFSFQLLAYKFSDFFCFIILGYNICSDLLIAIIFLFEILFSFYSILIMNHVFYVSSIVSYTMAPLYSCLSGDWFNFALSFAQVILASPLISFYLYYILKSVLSLGEILGDILSILKNIFSIFMKKYKYDFVNFSTKIFSNKYKKIFYLSKFLELIASFFYNSFLLFAYTGIGYVMFCFDKFIILLGILDYSATIILIIIYLIPSYIFFFQTIFNIKCKPINFVIVVIDISKERYKNVESSDSSDPSESTALIFKKLELSESKSRSESEYETEPESESFDTTDIDLIDLDSSESHPSEINNPFSIFKIYVILYTISYKIYSAMKKQMIFTEKYQKLKNIITKLVFAKDFIPLYFYSTHIAFDRHLQYIKMIIMIVFFVLNLIVIFYDIFQLTQNYSDYFLASVIIRFILIPLFSYYNIVIVLYHKAKDNTLRIVNYISLTITCLIVIAIIIGLSFISIYQSSYRLYSLKYVPPSNNISIANEKMMIHPICTYDVYNISAFDAFGYALGGYDIKRNKTIFENQMKIFFGENYSNHISYTVYELDKYFLFMKFNDSSSNTTIFGFRGYNSGPEIAFQFELFASKYIIPFFEDNVPLLDFLNDNWLSFYTDFLKSFGLRFFDNSNLIVKYVKSIMDIYEELNIEDDENVLFTGINCGGVIAKIVGTLLHKRSISFLSFPMELDFLQNLFHFSSSYFCYVTNVYNVDGFFSHPDSNYVNNIGIDLPVFYESKSCTSDFCDMFSRTDNVYRTFCTMSEMCGKSNQFNYYCINSIGEKDVQTIRERLQEND